jgi:hypothetical protein
VLSHPFISTSNARNSLPQAPELLVEIIAFVRVKTEKKKRDVGFSRRAMYEYHRVRGV